MPIPPADQLGAVTRGLHHRRARRPDDAGAHRRAHLPRPRPTRCGTRSPTRSGSRAGSAAPSPATCGSAGGTRSRATPAARSSTCEPPKRALDHLGVRRQVSWVDAFAGRRRPTSDPAPRSSTPRPSDPEMWAQFGPGAVGIGWETMLMGLAEHLRSARRRPGRAAGLAGGARGPALPRGVHDREQRPRGSRPASPSAPTPTQAARPPARGAPAAYTAEPEPARR